MHSQPDVTDPGLDGYWDFDDGEGQVAADVSGNGNDGVLGSSDVEDGSDPKWVDDVPAVGLCSLEGMVERKMLKVLDIKADILGMLEEVMVTEADVYAMLDEAFRGSQQRGMKNNVVMAKQKIHSAIQHEEQAGSAIGKSIEKILDALEALGIIAANEEIIPEPKGK